MQIWPAVSRRAEGYTQFLGSIRPAKRVERTRTNMSVGHAMNPMSEAHFATLRRHMVEVIEIQVDLASFAPASGRPALHEKGQSAPNYGEKVSFFLVSPPPASPTRGT